MSTRKKAFQTGWRVLVCVVLLGWVFHSIFMKEGRALAERQGLDWANLPRNEQWNIAWEHGPRELWASLSVISPGVFVGSVLVMGVTLLLGVWRWRMVLAVQGLHLPWWRATEISMVAQFFNSFLLGSTGGDLMKAYYAARETHHKKTEAVVTVLADRLVGLWAMLIFAALMMIPNVPLLFRHDRLRALALVILAMLAGCTMVAALAFRGGLSRRWSGARDWLRRLPKGEWLERLLDSSRDFGRERGFVLRTMGVSMILNAVCVVQVLILSWGLNLKVPILALFVIVPMIICISALPITPSGLGVRENLYVLVLANSAFAVDPTSALSLSLLAYAGFFIWSILGGMVYLMFREKHHLTEQELGTPMTNDQ